MLAEQLYGKGYQIAIYDPEVQLSRLLGANRRYIETHLPHLGELMVADLKGVIDASEALIVGSGSALVLDAINTHAQPHHHLIDLVGLGDQLKTSARVTGLAW
jgi:GDP-mannose 6-dehydrogenase